MQVRKSMKDKNVLYLKPEGDVEIFALGKLATKLKPISVTASEGGTWDDTKKFDGIYFDIFDLMEKISIDKLVHQGQLVFRGAA